VKRNLNVDFIGRRRLWLLISAVLVAVSVASLATRKLDLSIDFEGGTSFILDGVRPDLTVDELVDVAEGSGAEDVRAQLVQEDGRVRGAIIHTAAITAGTDAEASVAGALRFVSEAETIDVTFVGPKWGERVSNKALQGLAVFLVVIIIYITVRLEFKMAVAAVIALAHDLLITAGIYSLVGFPVSPATVVALLTILGYSLYDTVIVFDRVKERTASLGGPGKRTYGEAVNTAMNEVLWRSLNTSLTALLPVGSLLFIGSQILGAETLEDLSLALFVGMAVGAYSSLFVAGPFLAWWREREPRYAAIAEKARRREDVVETRGVPIPEADDSDDVEEPSTPVATSSRPSSAPKTYVRGPGRKPRSRRR